ncbi:MAG: DNA repair protein RecN [Corynebacteriales bacterium]|nr:DNA repair protein RecN [Mycobacteriales bacterium]
MLSEMRITNLGVIDDATLTLSKGFTVVTGETGAGKTMVVAGLGLLFGGRAEAARVRPGAEKAIIEGRIEAPNDPELHANLSALDADLDEDGSVIIARTVHAAGRTRGHVGGRSAPVAFLAELGERLVAVHGQSDQLRILKPGEQRAALDEFGQLADQLAEHRALYTQWRAVSADLADRTEHARERAREADLLRHGLQEIESVKPLPNEDIELKTEAQRLEYAEALRAAAYTAHQALAGDASETSEAANVNALAGAAHRALAEQEEHDVALAGFSTRAQELAALSGDLATELASYAESVEGDPARLEQVHQRRAALAALTRKYGEDIDAVLGWAENARTTLESLDTSEETLTALAARRDALATELAAKALQVSGLRAQAATVFSTAVTDELAGLAMPHASVVAHLSRRAARAGEAEIVVDGEPCAIGPEGIDEVELCLLAHPGAPALPLTKGASGGELSRVMLAIEVVFAGRAGPATMVFDEVDAGVGGKAAIEIGRRLAQLAKSHQVLVVTHLPQVAAFADHHLVVVKDNDGTVTTSGVAPVRGSARVKELARMLAGLDDSQVGLAHAEELLALASQHR